MDNSSEFQNIYRKLRCKQNCIGILPDGECDASLFLNQCGNWVEAGGGGGSGWLLEGNSGTDPNVDFIGTTDNVPIIFKTNNFPNYEMRLDGYFDAASGYFNKGIFLIDGTQLNIRAGYNSAVNITELPASGNTIIGIESAATLTEGTNNTVLGAYADVATPTTINSIALGESSIAETNQFAIGTQTNVKFELNGQNFGYVLQTNGTTANWQPGFPSNIITPAYGGAGNITGGYHVAYNSGSGATSLSISGNVGEIIIVSDVLGIASTSNITIDSGVGNTITSTTSSAQTLVIATDGRSVTLQKITSTKWMVI